MRNTWTIEKIGEGFDRFFHEYSRFPKAHEIDQSPYLPSSRYIQIKYGGLEKIRTQLGHESVHFGKGSFRSQIATSVNSRGRKAELQLERILIKKFGTPFVHTEKMFDQRRKNRVDFYIFSPTNNFGVEIFYPGTLRNLESNLNIKLKKYKTFKENLFYLVANPDFKQTQLDVLRSKKKLFWPKAVNLVTYPTFISLLKKFQAYHDPT